MSQSTATRYRGAEPFLLRDHYPAAGGDYGVLLVHGFTGSPAEMGAGGQLPWRGHARGYTVLAPRLCGHGTNEREMRLTAWPHWYSAVEDGYHLLRGLCRKVAAVGLSMGGLLVLKLAAEYPVDKVVSLSAPIYLADRRLPLLPAYRLFRRYIPKKRKRYDVDPIYTVGYDRMPLDCLTSLLELIKHVENLLPVITAPALVIQSQPEHTVRPESARHIYIRVRSVH
uniref:Lipase n=1 Tax=uncultured bacterium Rlip2 TaxID=581115 RepID=C0K085_9BACT|nr:lipase [uncultured bacterium Rlip2]